jgi:hypothetical protein
MFHARLFREHCVFYEGNYVKDLDRLGRDLHSTLIVDNSPASYSFHPDNAVPVSTWFDDPSDNELLELIPVMEELARTDNIYRVLSQHQARLSQPAGPQRDSIYGRPAPVAPPTNNPPTSPAVTSANVAPAGAPRGTSSSLGSYSSASTSPPVSYHHVPITTIAAGSGSTGAVGPGQQQLPPTTSTFITTTVSSNVSTIPITIRHSPFLSGVGQTQLPIHQVNRRSFNSTADASNGPPVVTMSQLEGGRRDPRR